MKISRRAMTIGREGRSRADQVTVLPCVDKGLGLNGAKGDFGAPNPCEPAQSRQGRQPLRRLDMVAESAGNLLSMLMLAILRRLLGCALSGLARRVM